MTHLNYFKKKKKTIIVTGLKVDGSFLQLNLKLMVLFLSKILQLLVLQFCEIFAAV